MSTVRPRARRPSEPHKVNAARQAVRVAPSKKVRSAIAGTRTLITFITNHMSI